MIVPILKIALRALARNKARSALTSEVCCDRTVPMSSSSGSLRASQAGRP